MNTTDKKKIAAVVKKANKAIDKLMEDTRLSPFNPNIVIVRQALITLEDMSLPAIEGDNAHSEKGTQ